jgi:hypothetical protein
LAVAERTGARNTRALLAAGLFSLGVEKALMGTG